MRSVLLAAAVAVLWAAPAAGAATPAPSGALEKFDCHRAKVALNRAISITAVMHAKPGLPKLELEFELQRRGRHSHRFTDVREGDLGEWITPADATLGQRPADVWVLDKQVVNLAAPAVYRFLVHFRWLGQQDTDEMALASGQCVQNR